MMKTKKNITSTIGGIIILITASLVTLSACTSPSATPAPEKKTADIASPEQKNAVAFAEGVPGGIMVNTIDITAKVTAIDKAERRATLVTADGEVFNVKAGPAAVNFDQVNAGDLVTFKVTEQLVVYLDNDGTAAPDESAAMVELAAKGSQPGVMMAEATRITGTVKQINYEARIVTLQFEDGSFKKFPVRDDIDLSKHRAGEKVVFLITEMVAISLEKK